MFNNEIDIIKSKKNIGESWIEKNYPTFHLFIYDEFIEDIPWKAKFYLYVNNKEEVPRCYCGNIPKYSGGKFKTYCSVKCSTNSEKVRKKINETNIQKYGNSTPLWNIEIRQKINNDLKKQGVENVSQLKTTKLKVKETNLKKYGVEYISQLDSTKKILSKSMKENQNIIQQGKRKSIKKSIINKTNFTNVKLLKINDNSDYEFYCEKCDANFHIHKTMLNDRLTYNNTLCTNCNKINSSSDTQMQIYEYVKSFYSGEILLNSRKIISKELDIYLPDVKIAIEYNGIYWHSDEFKQSNYHYKKTNECLSKDIILIQIWEDDWFRNSIDIKNYLYNLINNNPILIYERYENNQLIIDRNYPTNLKLNHIKSNLPKRIDRKIYNKEYITYNSGFDIYELF